MMLKNSLLSCIPDAISRIRMTDVVPCFLNKFPRLGPGHDFFSDPEVLRVIRSFLHKVEPSGHRDLKVSQSALQILGRSDIRSTMPSRVRKSQIYLTFCEDIGECLLFTGASHVSPSHGFKGMLACEFPSKWP
jgi:hypothetical protein